MSGKVSEDVHGKSRLARNILGSWGAQLVQIVSGFLVPRLIDHKLSQEALGVWDLAWSIVVYFNLVQMGVTSSINRYVAFHRAKGDTDGINRVISSVAMIMRGMSAIVFAMTVLFAWGVGVIFAERLGPWTSQAQWLVFILGVDIVVQVNATVYASILTGCHRWDWHNGIQAGTNIGATVGMIGALLLGQGLIALAVVNLVAETGGRIARVSAAYRLCPWLQIRSALYHRSTAKEMLRFGGKTFVSQVSQMIMNSSVSMLVVAYLGPAALALYARPLSLVRNVGVFVNKYAMVFSPTISSFQGVGNQDEVKALALKSTRYGLFLSLPVLLFLVFFGDQVVRLWMGRDYANPMLIALLVIGFGAQICYIPLFKALVSLNFHGQPGAASVGATVLAVIASYVVLAFYGGGVESVAICTGLAMTLLHGVYLPLYAARKLRVTVAEFVREVWLAPIQNTFMYAAALALARFYFGSSLQAALLWGGGVGLVLLVTCYWKSILPPRWKRRLMPWAATA